MGFFRKVEALSTLLTTENHASPSKKRASIAKVQESLEGKDLNKSFKAVLSKNREDSADSRKIAERKKQDAIRQKVEMAKRDVHRM